MLLHVKTGISQAVYINFMFNTFLIGKFIFSRFKIRCLASSSKGEFGRGMLSLLLIFVQSSGLYYKHFTIVPYDCNYSGLYYKYKLHLYIIVIMIIR
jgi:hypothetical protein